MDATRGCGLIATTAVFTFHIWSVNNGVYIAERLLLNYDFWREAKDGKKEESMVSRGISGEALC
jgi:hypothetical protein